jgi:hypothetical protein
MHLKASREISKITWVYISGAAFLLFFIFSIFMIFSSSTISSLGVTKSFYYILLIPVGLCSAAFLFGALHSHAKYVGKSSYGQLELTGPIVVFCLVIIGGFYFAEPETTFLLTVRLSNSSGTDEIINEGYLVADLGNQRVKRDVGENGEVLFSGISSQYNGKEIYLFPEIPGYKALDKNPIKIPADHVIYFRIAEKKDTSLVRGIIIDTNGNSLPNILVDFENGIATGKTDMNGKFQINVPADIGQSLLLIASLDGKILYRNYVTIPEKRSLIIKVNYK